jgi:sterol desaturase/sphingolipid hydroxylase (fatty acid hydroxylase superfamily)
MDTGAQAVGPFTELVAQYGPRVWDTLAANVPRDLRWNWLLLMLAIAVLLFVARKGRGAKGADGRERPCGFVEYLLPRDIYTHVSARVDIWLWVFERALKPVWTLLLLGSLGPLVEKSVIGAMTAGLGTGPALETSFAWMLLYSLLLLLSYDFTFFLLHYGEHKIPALWAIHKIHHSAEVLTPLTRYREHVLEGPLYSSAAAIGYAIPAAVFAWLFAGSITQITVLNVGIFALLFGFNGAFRHYHVQFRYPRGLEKWLQSPAMHHTHHSYLPQHWDTNMGVVTSIWDRLFGTLYIPEPDEHTPWGLGPEQQSEYRSFWQNVNGPFRDWYRMLRPAGQGTTPAPVNSRSSQIS